MTRPPRVKNLLMSDISNPKIMIVVAAALIDDQARVLIHKRPAGSKMAGLWEFPGGKVEMGETPEAALVREMREETGIEILQADLFPCSFASADLNDRHLLLLLYVCRQWLGEPAAIYADALRWSALSELSTIKMPPADLPLIAHLKAEASAYVAGR